MDENNQHNYLNNVVKDNCYKCNRKYTVFYPHFLCIECTHKTINKKWRSLKEFLLFSVLCALPLWIIGIYMGLKVELICIFFYLLGVFLSPFVKWVINKYW